MKASVELPFELTRFTQVITHAGAIVATWFRSGAQVDRKQDGSPITAADTAANEYLRGALLQLLPSAGWLSEETADDPVRLTKDWVWIVDPLDGTKEFAAGLPEFAVSVALTYRGRVVLGGVVNPATGEGGVGGPSIGFESWGYDRSVAGAATLASARASVSRREVEDRTVAPYLGLVGSAVPIGSVAYKLLRVAAGADDLTFSVQHKSFWDVCGGIGLIEAAGKVYERFDRAPLVFDLADSRIRSGGAAGPRDLVQQLLLTSGTLRGQTRP